MFTRTVEVTTKPGKAKELSNAINDKVLPILKKQSGFVDEMFRQMRSVHAETHCHGDYGDSLPLTSGLVRRILPG